MLDLEKLSKCTEKQIESIADKHWDKISPNCYRASKPKLYILGGQPGAGKSTTSNEIYDKLNGNCISINLDDYRELHPNAREIYKKSMPNSDEYSIYTNDFMHSVGEKILNKAIENGYNVILERTLNSDSISKDLDKFIKKGYELNLYIITCKKENSKTSAEQRYINAKAKFQRNNTNPPPRKISLEYQEKCFAGLGKTAESLTQKYKFNEIKVIFRDRNFHQRVLFDNTDKMKCNKVKYIKPLIENLVYGKVISITQDELNKIRNEVNKVGQKVLNSKDNIKNSKIIDKGLS